MVEINNSYNISKNKLVNSYIRNVDEYRKSVENALLPVISFFVMKNELGEEVVNLPSKIFNDQINYIKRLSLRYHKRNFEFALNPNNTESVYDYITRMIRHSKKGYQYSLCDLFDFMIKEPEQFSNVELPANLVAIAHEETKEFNHIIPSNINPIVNKQTIYSSHNYIKSNFVKYKTPEQLYAFVLSNVKRGIDFEILKMYDFLLENKFDEIRSDKLLDIENRFRQISETEYTKQGLEFKLKPGIDKKESDIWIDEWASNIRRGIETQDSLAKDFIDFIFSSEGTSTRNNFKQGSYPELIALVNHFYHGFVPKRIKLD
ncbi:hypothetical protein JXM83_04300 [Candidatus Woesearchaeota archaeon]|nr:hypothetical protein [Candidatus Woesearchaeota archaeon]